MSLPYFTPDQDPGPSFAALLGRIDEGPPHIDGDASELAPHGTTIVGLRFGDGVVIAGDRRATAGHLIAHRTMEKVQPADRSSAVGIAGAAGPAIEMVRLFQTELEHYEKVEGTTLSLEGKANKLAQMIRANLPAAMQGLAVVPLFAGFDERRDEGRLFTFDVTGGRYEETEHAATGSGSLHARGLVKHRWRPGLDRATAIDIAAEALFEAADEDSATGGPDRNRGLYPQICLIDTSGVSFLDEPEAAQAFEAVVARRREAGGAA